MSEPNLFSGQADANRRRAEPLAARMRPRSLAEYVGQEQILGRGRLLRRAIEGGEPVEEFEEILGGPAPRYTIQVRSPEGLDEVRLAGAGDCQQHQQQL